MVRRTLEIFDMDGVLAQTEHLGVGAFVEGLYQRLLPHMPGLQFDDDFQQACREEYYREGCCLTGFKKRLGLQNRWLLDSYRHINHRYLTPAIVPHLKEDTALVDRMDKLASRPGVEIIVFTQADRSYAHAVLKRVGLLNTVIRKDDVFDIRHTRGLLKRVPEAYHPVLKAYPGFDRYAMSEDTPINLLGAKRNGVREIDTSMVGNKPHTDEVAQHIDRKFDTVYELLDYKIAA